MDDRELDLWYKAYKYEEISEKEFVSKFEDLTKDYSVEQYLFEILWSLSDPFPIVIQRLILEKVLNLINIKDFWEIKRIKLDNDCIDTVPEFIGWLNEKSHFDYIDPNVANGIIGKILSLITDEDKQYLLKYKLITSLIPEENNVKEAAGSYYLHISADLWDER